LTPGLKRACFQLLQLRYDNPLSNLAFNFNLRPYSKGETPEEKKLRKAAVKLGRKVWRCTFNPVHLNPRLLSARFILTYDEPLANLAFNCNCYSRPCCKDARAAKKGLKTTFKAEAGPDTSPLFSST